MPALLVLLALLMPAVAWSDPAAATAPQYVGSAHCVGCHATEAVAWQGSHHAQAMQPATAGKVLGDFSNAKSLRLNDVDRFFSRNGAYFVKLRSPGLPAQELQIRYTFGVYPLQQYLVDAPGGRLQALTAAWDARPATQGGQRWFSLHPKRLAADDPLRWNGRDSNWNFMCAACHSTNLHKRYSATSDSYETNWTDLNVACEACHGPGSAHVRWAQEPPPSHGQPADRSNKGLTVELRAARTVHWGFWSAGQRIASPRGALLDAAVQGKVCFPCHARRQALDDGGGAGHELLDDYLPQMIEPGAYQADGQIQGEDFEFGSFAQSKMAAHGVTCTNCHDPHSARLRATGNALCTQCHRAEIFDAPAHTHHAAGSAGTQCVGCHMPTRTYMGVDVRRDHSFRVPRPDLSVALGTSNACAQCHRDRSADWAVGELTAWGHPPVAGTFAPTVDAAWAGAPVAPAVLRELATSPPYPPFVRGSLIGLLPVLTESLPPGTRAALSGAVRDADPLVRLGAARALAALAPQDALAIGAPLLADPLRGVRIEAARALAAPASTDTSRVVQASLHAAVDELVASEQFAAERPEAHVNLAQLYARLNRMADAEAQFMAALRLDPNFVPAMVNLADLYRGEGREDQAEHWLRQAIGVAPRAAEPVHALGLLEVRRGNLRGALPWLRKAVQLDPNVARFAYVCAVALSESGEHDEALRMLDSARTHLPRDQSLLDLSRQLRGSR